MPISKTQILDYFSLQPVSKLQKLYDYSQNILIPDEELLINVTMQQMMTKARALAAIHFPEWTDWSDSDWGRFIVELISLFSEKNFYYINGFANETFLSKAVVYSDVFVRACEFGYTPRTCTAAYLSCSITFASGPTTIYPVGSLVIIDSAGEKFTNASYFTVPNSGSPTSQSLILYNGRTSIKNMVFNGYRVDLVESNIALQSLIVSIGGYTWSRVQNFGLSGATDKVYMTIPEEDGSLSIFFGDGANGEAPPVDSLINVSYLRCLSFASSDSTLAINKSDANRPAIAATFSGTLSGYAAETISELRYNALLYKSTYNTLNTEASVESYLLKKSEIKRASAICMGNNVYFRVSLKNTSFPSLVQQNDWTTELAAVITMGYNVYYVATTYISVGPIVLDVYYLAEANSTYIMDFVKNLTSDYTNPLILADYGMDFNRNDLLFLLRSNIPSVQNVVVTSIQSSGSYDVALNKSEIMSAVSTGNITVNLIPV